MPLKATSGEVLVDGERVLGPSSDRGEAIFLSQRVHIMTKNGRLHETMTVGLPVRRDMEMKLTPKFLDYERHVTYA